MLRRPQSKLVMAFIILAISLSLIQNGIAQYIEQPYILHLPELIGRASSAPVHVSDTLTHMKFPTPTTIITDCTPSVCHNLGNLVQLMIVSNLLQNNVGSAAALKTALPIIREALSSPSLANICPDSLKRKFNYISSRIPDTPDIVQHRPVPKLAPNVIPNLEVRPSLFLSNDLLREVPNLNTLPNIIHRNLPLPVNTVLQNVPFDIFDTRVPSVNSLPPNIVYPNIPSPINSVSNDILMNTVLQNLPFDIIDTRIPNLSYLPPKIFYQNPVSPLPVTNNIPLSTVLQSMPPNLPIQNVQGLPAKIVFKSSPYESKESSPNYVFQNAPTGTLNTYSSSLPLSIAAPNTRPVLKFLITP